MRSKSENLSCIDVENSVTLIAILPFFIRKVDIKTIQETAKLVTSLTSMSKTYVTLMVMVPPEKPESKIKCSADSLSVIINCSLIAHGDHFSKSSSR